MADPARYCPACYAANAWDDERCDHCGTSLVSTDSFDERLTWALDHPDTATAMLAADLLARRGTRSAIHRLIEATRSSDPYRAAAAAGALASLDDDRARAAAHTLREHPSALVRRAVAPAEPQHEP
jgi:HEAT repeat protein